MSLPWFFGFDHINSAASFAIGDGAFDVVATEHITLAIRATGPGSRRCMSMTGTPISNTNTHIAYVDFPTTDKVTVGIRHRCTPSSDNRTLFRILGNGVLQIYLSLLTGSDIVVRRGGDNANLHTPISFTLNDNQFRYIEFSAYLHTTAGSFELRVDGVTIVSGSELNTMNSSDPQQANRFAIWNPNTLFSGTTSRTVEWLDVYIKERESIEDPGFYGPIVMRPLFPTADIQTDWTPDSGTENFSRVNNLSTASYVESTQLGDIDEYEMEDLAPNVNSILALVPVTVAWAPDGGAPMIKHSLVVDSNAVDGVERVVGISGHRSQAHIFTEKPGGGNWTVNAVNNARLRIEAV